MASDIELSSPSLSSASDSDDYYSSGEDDDFWETSSSSASDDEEIKRTSSLPSSTNMIPLPWVPFLPSRESTPLPANFGRACRNACTTCTYLTQQIEKSNIAYFLSSTSFPKTSLCVFWYHCLIGHYNERDLIKHSQANQRVRKLNSNFNCCICLNRLIFIYLRLFSV
jgi:hypothetical protein